MPPLTEAGQAIRRVNVTASEVGALLGEHPFTSPAAIYDRLCGATTVPRAQTEAMAFGSAVEPILTRMAEASLSRHNFAPVKIMSNSRTFEHRRVHLCATPDATIVGAPELVELKLSFSQNRWRNGLPSDIEWQARAQMACFRTHHPRKRVWVYVFSGVGTWYVVERDHGKERLLTQAVERFWHEHVIPGIRPAEHVPQYEIEYRRKKR